jgi:hypothetical protein
VPLEIYFSDESLRGLEIYDMLLIPSSWVCFNFFWIVRFLNLLRIFFGLVGDWSFSEIVRNILGLKDPEIHRRNPPIRNLQQFAKKSWKTLMDFKYLTNLFKKITSNQSQDFISSTKVATRKKTFQARPPRRKDLLIFNELHNSSKYKIQCEYYLWMTFSWLCVINFVSNSYTNHYSIKMYFN